MCPYMSGNVRPSDVARSVSHLTANSIPNWNFAWPKMVTLWKHNFRGKRLVFAATAASCQAFLLLGYDQGT